jgi:hypothetical protein
MNNTARRNRRELVYYMHDEFAAFRFQLAGDLSQDGVKDLDQAQQTASSVFGDRGMVVDLTRIDSVDGAGRELLDKWRRLGAQLVVTSPEAQARVQSIAGVPVQLRKAQSQGRVRDAMRRTVGSLVLLLAAAVILAGDTHMASAEVPREGIAIQHILDQVMEHQECKQ